MDHLEIRRLRLDHMRGPGAREVGAVIGMHQRLPEQTRLLDLLEAISEHRRPLLVGDREAAVRVPLPHPQSGCPQRHLQTLLGLPALVDLAAQLGVRRRQRRGALPHPLLEGVARLLDRRSAYFCLVMSTPKTMTPTISPSSSR
jgi:hypothetical protein